MVRIGTPTVTGTSSGSGSSGNLTFAQLESVAEQGGFSAAMAPLMAAIALAESSGNPNSTNPTDNGGKQTSWGLWQISLGNHNEPAPNWNDPVENAKLAYGKWKSQGLWAWGTWQSGAYKKYLPSGYVAPDSNIPGVNGATEGGQGAAGTVTTEGSWTSALGHAWSDTSNGLISWPGTVLGTFNDIDDFVGRAYDDYKLFFRPSTYIRAGAGIAGMLFLIFGIVFLSREAKSK